MQVTMLICVLIVNVRIVVRIIEPWFSGHLVLARVRGGLVILAASSQAREHAQDQRRNESHNDLQFSHIELLASWQALLPSIPSTI
jgi:hypothetical protein